MTCPRCNQTVAEEFYGPCSSCRTALRTWAEEEAERARRAREAKKNEKREDE